MKHIILIRLSILLTTTLLLNSCGKQHQEASSTGTIAPENAPLLKDDVTPSNNTKLASLVESQVYDFNASENFVTTTRHGMKINIPSGCLEDLNGNPISGQVKLEVTEYYTVGEIILGGISMHYKEGEQIHHFESDGMFTMHASQNNKPLKIAEGKQISAVTQRTKTNKGFEFYVMNDTAWEKDATNDIADIDQQVLPVLQKPINPHTPTPLIQFNPNLYTLEQDIRKYLPENSTANMSQNTVVQLDIDIRENRWILNKKNWKFDHKISRILRNKEGEKGKFDTIEYTTIYAVRGNKKYEELVSQKEQYDKELAAYNENFAARKSAGQLSVAELSQELIITQFGTYNIDRYLSLPPQLMVEKNFIISAPINITSNSKVYMIAKDSKNVIYPIDLTVYKDLLRFKKNEQNALIVINEDKIYGINQKVFEQTAKSQINQPQFDFQLKELAFNDVESFDKALESLF